MDSLDTLYLMGLTEDYKEAKEWIRTSLDLDLVRTCRLNTKHVLNGKLRVSWFVTVAATHTISTIIYLYCCHGYYGSFSADRHNKVYIDKIIKGETQLRPGQEKQTRLKQTHIY